jgi:hypothetical protein
MGQRWARAVRDHADLLARQAAIATGSYLAKYTWSHLGHSTFPGRTHPESADKAFRRWIRTLERLETRFFPDLPAVWARGTEFQQRGTLHFHFLLGNLEGVPSFYAMKLWEKFTRGHARIESYDPRRGGAFYVAKGGDVDFSDSWFDSRGRRPKP